MQCKHCGATNPDWGAEAAVSKRFCIYCGAELERPVMRQNAAAEPPTPPITPPPPMPAGKPKKPKKKRGGLIALIVVLVLFALAAAAFFTIHIWEPATCTDPETCKICGKTQGRAEGHEWEPATCTEPQTCETCGKTKGEPLGHDWAEATCTEPKTCRTCGETEGEAPGHDWAEATYDEPKTCRVCGETEGDVKGWVGYADADFATEQTQIGDAYGHAYVFDEALVGCRKMTVHFKLTDYTGSPFGTYTVYAHTAERGWYQVGSFSVYSSDLNDELDVPITFSDTPTIDSILVLCTVQTYTGFTYECTMYVDDIQVS